MPIHIEFTLTVNDYLQAQRLHAKRSVLSRLNDLLNRRLSPVFGILLLAFAIMISGPGVSWTFSYMVMIVCSVLLVFAPLYVRHRAKSCYRRTRMGDGIRVLNFDEQSINAQEDHVKSEFEWPAIRFTREDKNVLMLYLAPSRFIILPKRACSPEEVETLRKLCNAKTATQLME